METRRKTLRLARTWWLTGLLGFGACASEPSAAERLDVEPGEGTFAFYLVTRADLVLGDVQFEITGNQIDRILGTMQASDDSSPVSTAVGLPEGNAYTLRIKSIVVAGEQGIGDAGIGATCITTALFNVKAGRTTNLRVVFQCEELARDPAFDAGAPRAGSDASVLEGVVTPDAATPATVEVDAARPSDERDATQPPAETDAGAALPAPVDAGRADAGRADAGRGSSGRVDSGVDNTPLDGEGGPCEMCSVRECGNTAGVDRGVDCYMAAGFALEGPAMGQAKSVLCAGLVECAHETGCAAAGYEDCFCGGGVDRKSCRSEGPMGQCRVEYEAAAESTNPTIVLGSFNSPTLPAAIAARILACEAEHCAAECFPNAP